MSEAQAPLAWLPFSIAEASLTGKPGCDDIDLSRAWSYLLKRLGDGSTDRRVRFGESQSRRFRSGDAASAGASGGRGRRGVAVRS